MGLADAAAGLQLPRYMTELRWWPCCAVESCTSSLTCTYHVLNDCLIGTFDLLHVLVAHSPLQTSKHGPAYRLR